MELTRETLQDPEVRSALANFSEVLAKTLAVEDDSVRFSSRAYSTWERGVCDRVEMLTGAVLAGESFPSISDYAEDAEADELFERRRA